MNDFWWAGGPSFSIGDIDVIDCSQFSVLMLSHILFEFKILHLIDRTASAK